MIECVAWLIVDRLLDITNMLAYMLAAPLTQPLVVAS
jgi:hypothetical protein